MSAAHAEDVLGALATVTDEAPAAPVTSWAPVELEPIVNGDYIEAEPEMLARTDGRSLIYPARVHALHAEPEALKSWIALKACAERLAIAQDVLYIDFEDSAPSIISRLLALGVNPEAVAHHFVYVRPDEPLTDATLADLETALARQPLFAVIDGVTEALSIQGLSLGDNGDVATWLGLLPRRLVRAGAAVLLLDHVVKDREQRGRYAIGAQHKLAGVDVAYSMRVIEPFARGHEGLVVVKVEKDRPGRVREFASPDGQVATLRASSQTDGRVRIKLEPPERRDGAFRPTVLMERISKAVEHQPGIPKRLLRTTVRGNSKASDLALELLISEEFIDAQRDGQAIRHHPLKPYREADDHPNRDPVTKPCPNRDQSHGEPQRDPVTNPPKGVTVAGHGQTGASSNGHRDHQDEQLAERAEAIRARHEAAE